MTYIVTSARPFRGVKPGGAVDVSDLDELAIARHVRARFIAKAPEPEQKPVKKPSKAKETP